MKLTIHATAGEYLDAASDLLMRDEALNNLPLGVAIAVRDGRSYGEGDPLFATVEDEGSTVASFLRTPPYMLHVYSLPDYEPVAFELLASHLFDKKIELPGVIGLTRSAEAFARLWKERAGLGSRLGKGLRVFRLDKVESFPDVAGELVLTSEADLELAVKWTTAFNEAVGENRDEDYIRKAAAEMIAKKSLYLWVAPGRGAVCCVCNLRKIVTGEVINMVYTPSENRGNGFASAAVARLSQDLLDKGATFCSLFTDDANPISNKIYQRIGYKPLAGYSMLEFEE